MKTSLAVRLEELIHGTDDRKFMQIYRDLMDFKKAHFIEFKIINRISLLNDLVNIIEDEMEMRNNIQQLASEKTKVSMEKIYKPKKQTKPLITENWQEDWIEENNETEKITKNSDFKSILLWVIIFHVVSFAVMWGYNQYKDNVQANENKRLNALAQSYTVFPDYQKTIK